MSYEQEIEPLRRRIDLLNEEIIAKISERVEVAMEVGRIKRKHIRPVLDQTREDEVLAQIRRVAGNHNLDESAVERVFREIIELCTGAQMKDQQ